MHTHLQPRATVTPPPPFPHGQDTAVPTCWPPFAYPWLPCTPQPACTPGLPGTYLQAQRRLDVGHHHRVDGRQPAGPQVRVVVALHADAPRAAVGHAGSAAATTAADTALGRPRANLPRGGGVQQVEYSMPGNRVPSRASLAVLSSHAAHGRRLSSQLQHAHSPATAATPAPPPLTAAAWGCAAALAMPPAAPAGMAAPALLLLLLPALPACCPRQQAGCARHTQRHREQPSPLQTRQKAAQANKQVYAGEQIVRGRVEPYGRQRIISWEAVLGFHCMKPGIGTGAGMRRCTPCQLPNRTPPSRRGSPRAPPASPDSRCQMCSGDTQVCRPMAEAATASSAPPGSPGIALRGMTTCERRELHTRVARGRQTRRQGGLRTGGGEDGVGHGPEAGRAGELGRGGICPPGCRAPCQRHARL